MFEKNPKKALLLGIFTIVIWSSVATASSLAMQTLDPMPMIAIGLTLASILIALYLIAKKEFGEIKTLSKKNAINVFCQGSVLFSYYFFYFNAYANLPAQITSPLNSSWALVLVLFNAWFYKESFSKGEFVGMLIAYLGVILVAVGGTQSEALSASINIEGLASGVVCTFFFAGYWMVNRKCTLSNKLSLCLGFFVAGMWGIVFMLIAQPDLSLVSKSSWYALFYLTVCEWSVPYITWSLALKLTNSVPTISSLSFFTPFLALIWVALILGETIIITTMAGLVLIVCGTIVLQKFKKTHG